MKQYDDKNEFDQTLKSFNSVVMDESEKEEVYSNLMNSFEKKKRKNRIFKWSNHILTAALVAIFLIGGGYFIADKILLEQAAPEDNKNIETIETVLEQAFTGPDKELKQILNEKESYIADNKVKEYQNELFSYYEDVFQPYFEGNRFQDHVMNNKLNLTELAYSKGYQLDAQEIEVKKDEKAEDAYNFSFIVQYKIDEIKVGEIKLSGRVNVYEEGKINTLRFYDGSIEELINAFHKEE
ncbi:hypothetical protein [Rossellomorea sp. FM04394]|uniref:hypothetical protein n=1 Tax=Rossellomorea sp. FM04394 TaxID=3243076 RepID=UPI0035A71A0E